MTVERLGALAVLMLLGLLVLGFRGCGCGESEPPPGPPAPTRSDRPLSEVEETLEEENLWKMPTQLNPVQGLEPRVASRLDDLKRDYFEGRFSYVVQEAKELLDLAGDDPQMRLRLYYLMARASARNRQPSEASRYEKLFRDLYLKLHKAAPRLPSDNAKIRGLVERSEKIHKEVHPAWNADADGMVWANVRIFRLLDREGPHAVITEEHPGGGIIHASLDRRNLEAYLQDLGLLGGSAVIEKDQRFDFYYLLVGGDQHR